jgi:Holliday junction resolvasome RuvABC endonuclease subunit
VKILALDPATRCGWAHSDGPSGTWNCSSLRDESVGMRLIRFRSKLDLLLNSTGIDLVVFESARNVFHQGALVVQSELQGVLKLWCEDKKLLGHKLEYRGYSPSEIKKHATGKGNANKEAMIAAAKVKWPNVGDDNEADALHLLDLARSEYK